MIWIWRGRARTQRGGWLRVSKIGSLRLLGFAPDDVVSAPVAVVDFVASQVDASVEALDGYTRRRQTRWDHATTVEQHLGFRRCGTAELKERARRMRRYFTGSGATIYTWTSDRHAQYGTRIIPTTVREATHVLDAIFDNETDLQIEEHTTDTAGYTDLIFGLFELTGLTFSPRIRDIADQRLWRLPTTPTTGPAASLLTHRIKPDRIAQRWDDMCRVAATIRHGHEPASLLVARLQGSARQNHLTKAIQEHGRIAKTISILRYLHDEHHRRRIHSQLNKGESIHALQPRRDVRKLDLNTAPSPYQAGRRRNHIAGPWP